MACPRCGARTPLTPSYLRGSAVSCPACGESVELSFSAQSFMGLAVVGTALVAFLTENFSSEVRYLVQGTYGVLVLLSWFRATLTADGSSSRWSSEGG